MRKLAALLLLTLGGMAFGLKAETAVLKIDRFQQLKVVGPLNVDCVHCPDSVGMLVVESPDAARISWVEAKSNGDKLRLQLVAPDDIRTGLKPLPSDLPRVRVYTNYLTKVENEGDSTLRVLTAADVPQFEARLMGNGRLSIRGINAEKLKATLFTGRGIMVLNGRADKAAYRLAGVGTIEADGLECRDASVRMAGTGAVGVHATEKLKISGSGSGTVYSRGAPDVNKKMALGIKFQPID